MLLGIYTYTYTENHGLIPIPTFEFQNHWQNFNFSLLTTLYSITKWTEISFSAEVFQNPFLISKLRPVYALFVSIDRVQSLLMKIYEIFTLAICKFHRWQIHFIGELQCLNEFKFELRWYKYKAICSKYLTEKKKWFLWLPVSDIFSHGCESAKCFGFGLSSDYDCGFGSNFSLLVILNVQSVIERTWQQTN